jgi:tetratricopeptide (TPR) repeat protein
MLPAFSEALRQRDFVTAIRLARSEVDAKPNDPGAYHALGMALQGQGDSDAAREAYSKAIGLAPERAVYQMSLAMLDLSQTNLDEAETTINSALQADPNHLDAYVSLVNIALARGDNDKAASHLRYAQRVNPDHPDVLVAEGHVAQFSGRADHALKCFTRAVEQDPQHVLGQTSLGLAYLAKENYAFAEQAFINAKKMQPSNFGILRGLVEAQRMQNKVGEVLESLDELLLRHPQQHGMRALRGDIRLAVGNIDGALEDYRQLLEASPTQPQTLITIARVLQQTEQSAQAVAYLDHALQLDPSLEINWNTRLGLTANSKEQTADVLKRWREALPHSGVARECQAQFFEQTGDYEKAENLADEVLAISDTAVISQFIKLRAELRQEPTRALKRLEKLEASAKTPEAQRMVYSWKGFAHHLQGNYSAAGAQFREMLARFLPQHHLPKLFSAEGVTPSEISGTVLWAPCGLKMESILQALSKPLGNRLFAERNTAYARQDGFSHSRMPLGQTGPNGEVAGTAQNWQQAITERGVDPAQAVDWQPHWDHYTAAALNGVKLVALMMDPRDALLNWIIFGSAQAYSVYPNTQINAQWLSQVYEAVADSIQSKPDGVVVCVVDNLSQNAIAIAAQLKQALNLQEMPDVETLSQPLQALGGFETQLPAGAWRNYTETFGKEFETLTPVAMRLGYSAN